MGNCQQLSPSVIHPLSVGRAFGLTDVGLVRSTNEDNFLIDQDLGFLAVGDGMGGHSGGEIASTTSLLLVRDYIRSCRPLQSIQPVPVAMHAQMVLLQAVCFANRQLFSQNRQLAFADGRGMGTTLTGLWLAPAQGLLVVFHVGDSRLYRYRNGELCILTHDQTLYQQALEQGIIEHLPPRNLLLQAVGPSATVVPDVQTHNFQSGDLYLLCSDGLYITTPQHAIRDVLAQTGSLGLETTCEQLIGLAAHYGSSDNITSLLLSCD